MIVTDCGDDDDDERVCEHDWVMVHHHHHQVPDSNPYLWRHRMLTYLPEARHDQRTCKEVFRSRGNQT